MDGRTFHLVLEELGHLFSNEATLFRGFGRVPKKLFDRLNLIADAVYNPEDDAERKREREEAVNCWSQKIKEVCYELEDATDAYATELLRSRYQKASTYKLCLPAASYFSGPVLHFRFRAQMQAVQRKMEEIFKGLNNELVDKGVEKRTYDDQIRQDATRYSFVDDSVVIGRKGDVDAVLEKLLDENNSQEQEGHIRVIPIVGTAGIGKTTLAQLIYNDKMVTSHFDVKAFVPISDDFHVMKILKAILKSLKLTATDRLKVIVAELRKHIGGKQLLLVMDDVRTADDSIWMELRSCLASLNSKGVTILITTRFEQVARMQGTTDAHHLQELSTEECWRLFSTVAFSRTSTLHRKELEAIGREIVIKCNGLPLAAKHLGDYLQSRSINTQWLSVLNGELSDIDDFEKGFFPFFGFDNPNNLSLAHVSKQDKTETLPFIDHKVYGRDTDLGALRNMLCQNGQHEEGLQIIPIVGMAGIGKTTLAQSIYNDKMVMSHFDFRAWVCVSDDFDVKRILKEITEDLTGTAAMSDLLDILIRTLQDHIRGKQLLLVLDDVHTEKYKQSWDELRDRLSAIAEEITILATTRIENVAKMMAAADQVYHLEKLSSDDCWELFSAIAFSGRSEEECANLEKIGRDIVAKCNGLPLAAKTLGGYMRFKKTKDEWQSVLDSETSSLGGSEEDLLQIFERSFNHLHPVLKLCLSYCAVFPKGHSIEIDMLIKLWMAQGYLGSNIPGQGEGSTESTEMEKIGLQYLKELQMHSFFQDFRKDVVTSSMTCKLHGVVHKFLDSHPMIECFTKKVDSFRDRDFNPSDLKARHSSLVVVSRSLFPDSITKVEKLRSLLVLSQYAFVSTTCLHDLFQRLRRLRALCFSCCSISSIPSEIGKMNLLRYLNLSYNRNLKELPEAVCDLCNLQTLNLNGCDYLEKLPEGIGKLTNLRHLEILWTISLSFLPKGVRKLSSLLTLNRFIISRSSGHKACHLGDLKNLEKLQGYLYMDGLGNVTNVAEAREADLSSKEGLVGLDLWFSGVKTEKIKDEPVHKASAMVGSGVQTKQISPEDLLEALKPPSYLRYLGIYYYVGTAFPNWITSLEELRELILFDCRNCDVLPWLGKLPKLESLEIRNMKNVQKLSFDGGVSADVTFPTLKRLCIHNMKQWEDWEVAADREDIIASILFPSLLHLTIGGCPKLKALPDHLQLQDVQLKELSILECPILKERCQEKTGEDWGKIRHIPNIQIDGKVVKEDGRLVSDIASSSIKVNRSFQRARSRLV